MYDLFPLKNAVSPVWKEGITYNESVLPLEDESGNIPPIGLLYDAQEIIAVRSSPLDTVYEYGKDYLLENGELIIIPSGRIKTMKYSDYFFEEKGERSAFRAARGGYIYFSEGADMHLRQIAVTYRHNGKMQCIPPCKKTLLPKTTEKLVSGKPLKIHIHGDSISTGANSSGVIGSAPFLPAWYDMAVDCLKETYRNTDITLTDTAVGGTVSEWGAETAADAARNNPDLAIIGFGMNDGSGRVPAEKFGENISSIIKTFRTANKDCEFILISTILANKEVEGFYGLQEDYLPVLLSMEGAGTAVADMTTVHRALLSRKSYHDMTGNNVNHPNDFLARVYAQIILATMGAI